MESGYLGAIVLCSALLLFAGIWYKFNSATKDTVLYNDNTALIVAQLLTSLAALGITLTAGNAYLTDLKSTIISLVLIATTFAIVAAVIFKARRSASSQTTSAASPAQPSNRKQSRTASAKRSSAA